MTDRPAIKPTALDALQAIADLPTGKNEDEMAGQEMAYRAVEALFPTPPIIHVNSCLLDKQEAVEGEAVAWLVTTVRTGEKRLRFQPVANLPYNRDRFISTPLYASPPVPAGYAVREALERISRLTPAAANASSARDLHVTVKAIAETALSTPADTDAALDKPEALEGEPVAWRVKMSSHSDDYWHYFTKEPRYREEGEIWEPLFRHHASQVSAGDAGEPFLQTYDAGLLGDGGGGDVSWWHDYIRAELERAHEFYADQFSALSQSPADTDAAQNEIDRLRRELEEARKALEPFARFAENVAYQEGEFSDGFVWQSAIHRESISTWFGPSDFGVAFAALRAGEEGK